MDIKDWIYIGAVLLAPIAAVQVQKWLERFRENKQRKVYLFKTLMTTRASRVSIDHVQALNMIDIEFTGKKYQKIVMAWRLYHDNLSNESPKKEGWADKNDELFIDLLFQMGNLLGYKFDKVMLKRTAYTPVAHGDIEFENQAIRKGLTDILSGKSQFPVFITNDFSSNET